MAWRLSWCSYLPVWALVICGCTLDNPAFDEPRDSVGKGSDDGSSDAETRGADVDAGDGDADSGDGDGDGDSSTGDGDGDSGTGDGDGDSGTGDGDGDTDTDTDSTETGNDMPCMGLEPIACEMTDNCVPVFYEPMQHQNGFYCIEPPVYDGCLPEIECDPPAGPFWCKFDFYIKADLDGCLPSVVAEMGLDACNQPGNGLVACDP